MTDESKTPDEPISLAQWWKEIHDWIPQFGMAFYEVLVEFRKSGRRERIATAALQGFIATSADPNLDMPEPGEAAAGAIAYADALIAELDREQPKEPT